MKTTNTKIYKIAKFTLVFLLCTATSAFAQERLISDNSEGYPAATAESQYIFDVFVPPANIENIQAPDGNNYLVYSFAEGVFTAETGKSKLPVIYEKIAIPNDAQNVQVAVVNTKERQEKISDHIYPITKKVVKKGPQGITYVDEEFFMDQGFYKNYQGFYPDLAVVKEIAEMRGLRFAIIEIRPYQYNPSQKLLKINEEISLKITWSSKTGSIDTEKLKKDSFLKPMLKKLHNFNDTESIKSGNIEPESLIKIPEEDDLPGTINRPTDLLAATHTEYLIITANDFYNSPSIGLLAHHRASTAGGGYDVSIVRLQDIYNTNFPDKHGTETNDQLIKMFIKYAYDYWNGTEPSLKFILLVGDAITDSNNLEVDGPYLVPIHISSVKDYYWRPIATDHWYSCMDGSYPIYLDDIHDKVGDIAIGRFAIRTQQELQRVINKTINYETVYSNIPGDWRSQAGLLSGFAINQVDGLAAAKPFFTNVRNRLVPHYQEVLEDYRDNSSIYSDDPAGSLLFKERIKSYFNEGRLMVVIASHGTIDGLHDGENGFIFNSSDINLLTNTAKLPAVVSMACYTGYFDYSAEESLGESFLKNTDAGAIAFLGPSRADDPGSYSLIYNFINQVFVSNSLTIGNVLLVAKNGQFPPRYALLYNLLGDPALNISRVKQHSIKPDLTCFLDTFEVSGNNVTFHAIIKNSGLGDADNVSVDLYDGDPNQGGKKVATTINSVVPANQEVSCNITTPLLWDKDFKGYLYLLVDGSQQISELTEANNLSSFYFYASEPYRENYIARGYTSPAISGNKIVWYDASTGSFDIYLYDLGSDAIFDTADDSGVIRISASGSPIKNPVISGNKIIWYVVSNGNYDIYLYDLGPDGIFGTADDSGEIRVTTDSFIYIGGVTISGNKIVWFCGFPNGSTGVCLYDLGPDGIFGTADDSGVVNVITNRWSSSISGNKIVWLNTPYSYDIYLYDLGPDGIFGTADDSGELRITTDTTSPKDAPSISGNKIVWLETRSDYPEVYFYDLGPDGIFGTADDSGEVRISAATSSKQSPDISGNRIVWLDRRNVNFDIYMYDLGPDGIFGTDDDPGEKYLTINPTIDRRNPKIYGSKVVYYGADRKTGNSNIYLIDINSPPVLSPIGNKTAYAKSLLSFRVSAFDQDGDVLRYSARDLPRGACFNALTRTFRWTPKTSDVGVYHVTFRVTDSAGASDSETIQIRVEKKRKFVSGPVPLPVRPIIIEY